MNEKPKPLPKGLYDKLSSPGGEGAVELTAEESLLLGADGGDVWGRLDDLSEEANEDS